MTVGGAVAREFMAADADTDPRLAPCSTLLRAGPLAMGRPRRSADALVLPVAVCLHGQELRLSLTLISGPLLVTMMSAQAHQGYILFRSIMSAQGPGVYMS